MIRSILRWFGLEIRVEKNTEKYARALIQSIGARTAGHDSALPQQIRSAWQRSSGCFELFAAALADLLLDLEKQARQATRTADLFREQVERQSTRIIELEMERDARRTHAADKAITRLQAEIEMAELQTELDAAHRRVAELEATLAQERTAHAQRVAQLEADIANLNRIVVERQELIDQLTGEGDGPDGWRPLA